VKCTVGKTIKYNRKTYKLKTHASVDNNRPDSNNDKKTVTAKIKYTIPYKFTVW
jgi:hypothetical protein